MLEKQYNFSNESLVEEYKDVVKESLKRGKYDPNIKDYINTIYKFLKQEEGIDCTMNPEIRIFASPNPILKNIDLTKKIDEARILIKLFSSWPDIISKTLEKDGKSFKIKRDGKNVTLTFKDLKDELFNCIIAIANQNTVIDPLYQTILQRTGLSKNGNTLYDLNFQYILPLLAEYSDSEFFKAYTNFLHSGVFWYVFMPNTAYVLLNPLFARFDNDGKLLHSTTLEHPALEWSDGTYESFIEGIHFDNDMWKRIVTHEMTTEEALKLENIEQRSKALKVVGYESIIKPEYLIDTHIRKANTIDPHTRKEKQIDMRIDLYLIPDIYHDRMGRSINTAVLRYKDPSTDRIYFSVVPPNTRKAVEGMAWKMNMSVEDYNNNLILEC